MNNFIEKALEIQDDILTTENGANAYKTTGEGILVDLFANLANLPAEQLVSDIVNGLYADREVATKMAFYLRDPRNGIGRRKLGRISIELAIIGMISYASTETDSYKEALIIHIIKSVVKYGRWDDVIEIYNDRKNDGDHETATLILQYMGNVIENDITLMKSNSPISLLAKWLPSEKQDIDFVKDFIKVLSAKDSQVKSFKDYRKNILVPLRRHLDIVEHYVTEGKLDDIDFAKVPSCAMRKYRTKFYQSEKFVKYIEQVTSGEKKINASVLSPYQILRDTLKDPDDPALLAMWKALPNYVEGEHDVLVIPDCSRSMYSQSGSDYTPLEVAVSIAIYFAERNSGIYKNYIMSFASEPKFNELKDEESIKEKYDKITRHDDLSTNLDATFRMIYKISKESKSAPKALMIISDNEINKYYSDDKMDIVDAYEKLFNGIGVKFPKVIFWGITSNRPAPILNKCNGNCVYISGTSPSILANLNDLINLTPYEAMLRVLSKYDDVIFGSKKTIE